MVTLTPFKTRPNTRLPSPHLASTYNILILNIFGKEEILTQVEVGRIRLFRVVTDLHEKFRFV